MDTNAPGEKKAPGAFGQLAPGTLENHAANLPQPLADSNEIRNHIFGVDSIFSDPWTALLWHDRDPYLDITLAGFGWTGDRASVLCVWRPIFPRLPDYCYRYQFLQLPPGVKWKCSVIWTRPYYKIAASYYYKRLPYRKRKASK